MIADMAGFILTCLSITGVIIGAARWLLSVYYNKEKELVDIKQGRMDAAIYSLKETTDEHSKVIRSHKDALLLIEKDLKYAILSMDDYKKDLKISSLRTDEFIRKAEQRLSRLEAISENLFVLKK